MTNATREIDRELPDEYKRTDVDDETALIYHRIEADESLLAAADTLWTLIKSNAEKHPNKQYHLALDIDGHRNDQGGFTNDMVVLQKNIITGIFFDKFLQKVSLGGFNQAFEQQSDDPDVYDPTQFEFEITHDSEHEEWAFGLFFE